MTLKWLKVLKLSSICFKMLKAMTPKTTDQNMLFLNERISFNLYCRLNECGIKLLILINNYTTSESLVCQIQAVCGRFQSENWTRDTN